MATEFQMPKLGLTMESGTIIRWLVPDRSEVSLGQPVLLIETDKVESEIVASGDGILAQTATIGETYDCGAPIGWLLAAGEEPPTGRGTNGRAAAGGRLLASPNARRVANSLGVELSIVVGSGPGGRIVSEDVEAVAHRPPQPPPPVPPPAPTGGQPRRTGAPLATFAARSLADLLGVDLGAVTSVTGDHRLTKDDVAAHVRQLLAGATAAAAPDRSSGSAAPVTEADAPIQTPSQLVPLRGMRGTIAKRMHRSLQDMAQLTLTIDVDMSTVIADRQRRRSAASDDADPVPGYTDYVIAATARALVEHPYANSQVTADAVAHLPEVNIGLAVALDDGLIVPVVRRAPDLDLDELTARTAQLAADARAGALGLADLEGGTFSVTTLGMYGVDGFTPVINPPNSAILGIGRLRDDTTWEDGRPQRVPTVTLSLTWDHRAFDGAPAAVFAQAIKHRLEAGDFG